MALLTTSPTLQNKPKDLTKTEFDTYLNRVFKVKPKKWKKGRLLYNPKTHSVTDPYGKLIAIVSPKTMAILRRMEKKKRKS